MEIGMQTPLMPSVKPHHIGRMVSWFLIKLSFIFILAEAAFSGLFYVLFPRELIWRGLIPPVLSVLSGLLVGIFCRILFQNMAKLFRWFLAALIIGFVLTFSGLVGQEWLNIDLTGISSVMFDSRFASLMGIGWVSAFLTIFAWQKKKAQVIPIVESMVVSSQPIPVISPVVTRPTRAKKVKKNLPSRKFSFPPNPLDVGNKIIKKSILRKWNRKSKRFFSNFSNSFEKNVRKPLLSFVDKLFSPRPIFTRRISRMQARPGVRSPAAPLLSPTPLPRKRLGRKMSTPIRLVGKEELRCPYCLQIVDRKDKGGIVVCPICKAAHHKECWDITGSCQVPHNHAVL